MVKDFILVNYKREYELIDSTPNLEYAVSSLGTKVRSFELA
jgi:hypothetical protein